MIVMRPAYATSRAITLCGEYVSHVPGFQRLAWRHIHADSIAQRRLVTWLGIGSLNFWSCHTVARQKARHEIWHYPKPLVLTLRSPLSQSTPCSCFQNLSSPLSNDGNLSLCGFMDPHQRCSSWSVHWLACQLASRCFTSIVTISSIQ